MLHQWQGTIDQLNECRTDPNALQWLLGRVDWVSKKWLLDQMDAKASWMIRKKVDLRFHELSEAGYQRNFRTLSSSLISMTQLRSIGLGGRHRKVRQRPSEVI